MNPSTPAELATPTLADQLAAYPATITDATRQLHRAQDAHRSATARVEQLRGHYTAAAAADETLKNETARKAYVADQMARQKDATDAVDAAYASLQEAEVALAFYRDSFQVAKLLMQREVALLNN